MGGNFHMTLTDADKARALARFRSVRGEGGVRLAFVTLGPIVRAVDPEELRRATIDAIVVAVNGTCAN